MKERRQMHVYVCEITILNPEPETNQEQNSPEKKKLEQIPTALHARNCMNFLTFLQQFSSVTSTEIVGSGSNLVLSSKVKESQTFMQEALFC